VENFFTFLGKELGIFVENTSTFCTFNFLETNRNIVKVLNYLDFTVIEIFGNKIALILVIP
jgi:hypothetical protein